MWCDCLDRNYFLKQLYNDVPDLNKVQIHRISVERDGEQINIVFAMPAYPDNPPEKWSDCDVVYVELGFFGISGFTLIYNNIFSDSNIDISKQCENVKVDISGSINCSFTAEAALVQRISGF